MEEQKNYQIVPYSIDYNQDHAYVLTQPERDSLQELRDLYNRITQDFPVTLGQGESKKERDFRQDPLDSCLVYGEIDFTSFAEIFFTIKNRYGDIPAGTFYDLGSGAGKAVIAAALLHPFQECVGIEILENLHSLSLNLKERFASFNVPTPISFFHSDIFTYNWTDACFVFSNSTCFDLEMMHKIGSVPVKAGTIGVSFTKPFRRDQWNVLEVIRKEMSWGPATVFIQEKS